MERDEGFPHEPPYKTVGSILDYSFFICSIVIRAVENFHMFLAYGISTWTDAYRSDEGVLAGSLDKILNLGSDRIFFSRKFSIMILLRNFSIHIIRRLEIFRKKSLFRIE